MKGAGAEVPKLLLNLALLEWRQPGAAHGGTERDPLLPQTGDLSKAS